MTVALNDLETTSLITSMITIYCGIYFISDLSGFDFEKNVEFAEFDNGCKNWFYYDWVNSEIKWISESSFLCFDGINKFLILNLLALQNVSRN